MMNFGYFWVSTLIIILIYLLTKYLKNRKRAQLINEIPGPKTVPILGNLLKFAVPAHEILPTFRKLHEQYGDIVRTWHGSRPVVHLVSPEHVEVILAANKHIRKGTAYQFIMPWLGTGLLTSSGRKWFTHRKLISPTFHFKVLEGFIDIFYESSQVLETKLANKTSDGFFDIMPYITRCALDIICETAMGTKINAQEDGSNEFVDATLRISHLIVKRQFKVWLHPDKIFYNTQYGKEFMQCLKTLHGFTEKVISDRKRIRDEFNSNVKNLESDNFGMKERLAFLDLLLESAQGLKVPLTDREIREEVDTFVFEGHDTTTTAISWTLLLLGNHPDIQDAVRNELESIFHYEHRQITLKDLGQMKLLERVIKESLRLYPSVTIISRLLDEDVQLGKYLIPAETNIAVQISAMHRQPNLYPDPLKFDPDRFLPENLTKRHPFAYLPFSAGQRNCIGQKFALYEEKIMLCAILRKFKVRALHTPDEVPSNQELVNRPRDGIFVKLYPVN